MSGLRVVVAVSPRLLGDALCRALARDGHDATTDLGLGPYDVAVVTVDRQHEVQADRVIVLPDEDSDAAGVSSLALLRDALRSLG